MTLEQKSRSKLGYTIDRILKFLDYGDSDMYKENNDSILYKISSDRRFSYTTINFSGFDTNHKADDNLFIDSIEPEIKCMICYKIDYEPYPKINFYHQIMHANKISFYDAQVTTNWFSINSLSDIIEFLDCRNINPNDIMSMIIFREASSTDGFDEHIK